ncbi:otolin-1-A-like isoform X2 [Oncorhynchus clarkii lewisi]
MREWGDDMGSRFKGDKGDQGFPGQHGTHREREKSWSQGQRVNQDLTDPLGYLVYLGKMEGSNLRVRLVCQDCEGQRVPGKGIPGEKGSVGQPGPPGIPGAQGGAWVPGANGPSGASRGWLSRRKGGLVETVGGRENLESQGL